MTSHPFWFLVIMACVIWYSTITIYVAVQGLRDIRKMLHELGDSANRPKQDV